MAAQVLPVILNIRLSSARLEFFRSLAQTVQTPEVQVKSCTPIKATSHQHTAFHCRT